MSRPLSPTPDVGYSPRNIVQSELEEQTAKTLETETNYISQIHSGK